MKETRNSPHGHAGNKTVVIKAGGAGGVGSVVLVGGALAAAAFASVFVFRLKRRGSGEDSSPEINKKCENSKRGDEKVELENDSSGMISDQSLKLDDDANVETADGNDAVSDCDFVIVNEEREGDDGDGEIVARSDEEDAREKEMQPRQEENSQEWHDRESSAVEEVGINQTKEFEGLCNANGAMNEERFAERTVVPQFDGEAQQDNLVVDEEEAPLPTDGVDNIEEHRHVYQSDAGQIQNHLLDDLTEVKNGVMRELHGKQDKMNEAEEVKVVENGEARTGKMSKSKWESWATKYEVGGKIQEDRVEQNNRKMKEEGVRRVMIWMVCVLSSFSCSWFLELSYGKLGLLVLFTVFLLEMYGYSLQKEIVAMIKVHTQDI